MTDIIRVGRIYGSRKNWDRLRNRVREGFPIYVLQIHYPNSGADYCSLHESRTSANAEVRNLRKHGVDCPISILKKEK